MGPSTARLLRIREAVLGGMYTLPTNWAQYWERIVREPATDSSTSLFPWTEPLMRFFHKRVFRGHVWRVPFVAFALYYGGSFVAAWLSRTLYSPDMLKPTADPIGFTGRLSRLALFEAPRSDYFVPFLKDFTHLNFAILVCLIAYPMGYGFILAIPREFQTFFDSGVPDISSDWASDFLGRFRRSVASRWSVLMAAIYAVLAAGTFVMLARSGIPDAQRWWGNTKFGLAGYYLALVQGLSSYSALWGFTLFIVLNRHIREATERVRVFRPFHEDGYYGFQPLARLLAWQAAIVMAVGVALFSTYSMTYFGLEKSFLILLSMLAFTITTGIALARPLYAMTMHVRRLRENAIRGIEPHMQQLVDGLAEGGGGAASANSRDEVTPIMSLYSALRACRTIPFGLASLNTVILGYLWQAVLLLRAFYHQFHS
jgi:hypothetical protein